VSLSTQTIGEHTVNMQVMASATFGWLRPPLVSALLIASG
jgi:hypothetical protein